MNKLLYTVTVRDTYIRENVEEQTCETEGEAKNWVKQFRNEYPADSGYKVKTAKTEYSTTT